MKKFISFICLVLLSLVTFAQDTTVTVLKDGTIVKSFQSDFKDTFFGDVSAGIWVACLLFAIMGFYIKWYISAKRGVKYNLHTPMEFSWKYWWRDNALPKLYSFTFSLFVTFIALRFIAQLFPDWAALPIGLVAVIVGIAFDYVVARLKRLKPEIKEL